MSRSTSEAIAVKPGLDVYTGLLAAATVACLVGLVILYFRAKTIFPNDPIFPF